MRRLSTAILAIGIALVFIIYMVTYTVGFNEKAIITTFGNATEPDEKLLADNKDTGSVMQEPGLKFKWPWPIQQVQVYPTRLQVLDDTPEQIQLNDGNTIIINLALTWRIEDPLDFSISLGTIEEAEDKLRAQMRDLRSIISTDYRFDQLVNDDPGKVELDQLEAKIEQVLADRLEDIEPSYGIAVAKVTVGQMLYTESTATSVNERMTAAQERKAQEIRSQGDSQAKAIVSEANSISDQLKNFADTVATQIEIVGIREANQWLAKYSEPGANEDLAIYLRQLEAMEQVLANRTTFILDARTFSPLNVLIYGHGGPGNLSRLSTPTDEAGNEPAVAAPIDNATRAEMMRGQIESLEQRVQDLVAQLRALEEQAPPGPREQPRNPRGGSALSQLPTAPNSPAAPPPVEPKLDPAQQSLADALRVSFGLLKLLMAVLLVVYIASGVFRVDEQNSAVRYRFGEPIGEVYGPGWHFGLPFPIEEVIRVPRTTQTVRLDESFWYDNPENLEPEALGFEVLDPLKDSFLITGDTNVVHVQFGVNYVIPNDAVSIDRYLTNVGSLDQANSIVQTAAERGMIHYIASATVEDIIGKSKFDTQQILGLIQKTLDDLQTGIRVQQVLIDNNNQSMPNQVRVAYAEVTKAQADKVKAIQEARRTYDETLGRAAGGSHRELLLMIRAYEAALASEDDALATVLRVELDRSIRALRLPPESLLSGVKAYRDAVTAAAGSDDASLKAGADEAAESLRQSLETSGTSQSGDPIAGDVAAAISRAKANRSQISTHARLNYERYASALEAYNKTPLVLASDRLQATREKLMTGLTLNVVGKITRIETTPDPRDVEEINTAEFEKQREAARAAQQEAEANN